MSPRYAPSFPVMDARIVNDTPPQKSLEARV